MKNNQFDNYSPDELEAQRRVISAGYLVITIASLLAMTFFVTHNMIGTSKPIWDAANGLNWGFGQLAYLVISVGFAIGFNAFTWNFYQMESNARQRAFVLFVAVAFPMFTEVGQSMTRTEETRHEAATSSVTFQVMRERVKNAGVSLDMGVTSALSLAMAEKAKAETELTACTRYVSEQRRAKCSRIESGNIAAAQAKIMGFQQAGRDSVTASSSQLQKDAKTLKELEGDTDYLQPIVRFLMSFGIPAIGASFLIAFIIIGAMEVAMAYLGGLLRQLKDRMRVLGIAVSSDKVKARYVKGSGNSSPPTPSNNAHRFTPTLSLTEFSGSTNRRKWADLAKRPAPSQDLNTETGLEKSVSGLEKQVSEDMLEKVANIERKLANQKAEIEAKAAQDLAHRSRMATQNLEARQRAEATAAKAAQDLAKLEAEMERKRGELEERGTLTDEQIDLAATVIRAAIIEGHLSKIGNPQTAPILKAAGLPASTDTLKALNKLACKVLEREGLVIQNPNHARGQSLYIIA